MAGRGSGEARRSTDGRVSSEIEMAHLNEHVTVNDVAVVSLLFSASKGDLVGVQRSLEQNDLGPNVGDYDFRTALHIASSEGHADVVKYLLSNGANVNAVDRFGNTPIDDAIRQGHHEITSILIEHGADKPSAGFELELITASSHGDVDAVKRLLLNKVDPNCHDYDKRTPLHLAAAAHSEKIVRLLLAAGADVAAEDRWGKTPLADAVRSGVRLGDDPVVGVLREASEKMGIVLHASTIPFWHDAQVLMLLGMEALILILHAIFGGYDEGVDNLHRYPLFQDVHVMIFIGFGFLMTFLRKYGYSSVAFNLAIAAFVIQWYPLLETFWANVFSQSWTTPVQFDVGMLITSDFCAGAVLITFGALLGKTSLTQMLFIAFAEPFFYTLNERIALHFEIADIGGSMIIHTFGAFFGLAASRVLTPVAARGPSDNAAVYHSDLFSMVGTIFLWLFWPSFNGAFTDDTALTRAVVNTVLSLTGSTMMAFLCSYWIRGHNKLFMVDIQNATLAGGVAVGATANMVIQPATALAIGMIAGSVSVFGYAVLQARLERLIGLHDTCGVLNLHGMPGVMGGAWSCIGAAFATPAVYGATIGAVFPAMDPTSGDPRSAQSQAVHQFVYLLVTLGIALASGAFVGFLASLLLYKPPKTYFLDSEEWEVPELEKPYYFDKRGENTHQAENRDGPAIQRKLLKIQMNQYRTTDLDTRLSNMEATMRKLQADNPSKGSSQLATTLADLNQKVERLMAKQV